MRAHMNKSYSGDMLHETTHVKVPKMTHTAMGHAKTFISPTKYGLNDLFRLSTRVYTSIAFPDGLKNALFCHSDHNRNWVKFVLHQMASQVWSKGSWHIPTRPEPLRRVYARLGIPSIPKRMSSNHWKFLCLELPCRRLCQLFLVDHLDRTFASLRMLPKVRTLFQW